MMHHFSPFPVLHTPRLQLRQLSLQDEQEIWELRSNDAVNQFLNRSKAQSPEDARRFIQLIIENLQKNETVYWAIALQNDPKLIGTITLWNLNPNENSAELGYELLPPYQGQGLMQEALAKVIEFGFSTMQLQTIVAESHVHNIHSAKLLEKNHFIRQPQQEGSDTVIFQLTSL